MTGMMPATSWLCLGLLAAILWLFQKAKRLFWAFSLLVWPGTFCHELSHDLTGLILNGRPVAFSVYPRREENRIRLGAVMMANLRWYNAFFIGMAPLALLLGAWLLFHWILGQGFPLGLTLVLLIFLVANLAYGSIPSGQDCRIAAGSPVGWGLLALGLMVGWSHVRAEPRTRRPSRTSVASLPSPRPQLRQGWAEAERLLARGRRRTKALLERLETRWTQRRREAIHD